MTDQYLQNHINHAAYAVCYNEIVMKVNGLNIQGLENQGRRGRRGRDEEEEEEDPCTNGVGSIQQSCEPRFLLHRFWSLYESMVNSEYLVVRFKLANKKSRIIIIIMIMIMMIMNRFNSCKRIAGKDWSFSA